LREEACSGRTCRIAGVIRVVVADAGEGAVGAAEDGDWSSGCCAEDGVELPSVDYGACVGIPMESWEVVDGGEVVAELYVVIGWAAGAVQVEGVWGACMN